LRAKVGDTEFVDHLAFKRALELAAPNVRPIPGAADIKAILEAATWRDETCAPVIAKDLGARGVADPLHGRFAATVNGKRTVVEYAHDAELRDTEQVPLLEEGGVAGFLAREVLPYAPDAWFNPASVKVGYEISFNRHFYAPPVMRTLEEIGRDIADAEREASAQLASLLQGVSR
jgi:type I restriction enzyme M protein